MPKINDFKKERSGKGNFDASKLRKWVDISDMLSRLGIEFKQNGSELIARCPNKLHDDKNPSWSIRDERGNESNGLFFCYSCKWGGDVFKLIQEVKGCSFFEALEFVRSKKGDIVNVEVEMEIDIDVNAGFRDYWPKPIQIPKGVVEIKRDSKCYEYLSSRGIQWGDIQRYGLQDWKWKRRVFVPLKLHRYLVSWLARTYNDDERKVLNRPGKDGTKWALFGTEFLDKTNLTIHLTEGWIDAIRLHQGGYQNAIAVCGSTLSEEKIKQLTWVRKVIYWADGDKAGRRFAMEVRNWFTTFAEVFVIELDEGKDPADHSTGELRQKTKNL
jgi:DNA primase